MVLRNSRISTIASMTERQIMGREIILLVGPVQPCNRSVK